MNKELSALRESYSLATLSREDLTDHPIAQFKSWFEQARKAEILEPNAMTLSTIGNNGIPSARVVLLKEIEEDGLIFYTNYDSQKAQEIDANPQVALTFLWKEIQRQVRIVGKAEKIGAEQSERYFQSRPKASQIGAWASEQSAVIPSRQILEDRKKELELKYHDVDVLPLPPFWGGYKVVLESCEFWQGRRSRLHDRFRYTHVSDAHDGSWKIERLSS